MFDFILFVARTAKLSRRFTLESNLEDINCLYVCASDLKELNYFVLSAYPVTYWACLKRVKKLAYLG